MHAGEPSTDPPTPPSPSLDPEDDSEAALKTLRGYLLGDLCDADLAAAKDWPQLNDYVGDLCSLGIDKLSREPEVLALDCARTRGQLEDVSCRNYRALIASFECAGAVRDGVGSVRSRLDDLISVLPPLAVATRQFSAEAAAAQALREEKLRTLAEHGRVVNILEMPRLMKALVAGELYEEALDLQSTSVKFLSLGEDEEMVSSVCAEVEALTRQMVLQLVSLLRGPVQLPAALRVVGYLRRLGAFSEPRLRMLFLQCRGDWLRSSLDSAVSPSAQAKLVRLSDDTRAMLFEIVTQYRAAFADDDDVGFGSVRQEPESSALFCASILYDWTAACVQQYLERLDAGLRDVRDGASLGTILQQAMYCGQSLGRVGADFRPALAPIFEVAVMRVFNSHLTSALRQFEMMVEDHRWAPVGSSALRKARGRGGIGTGGGEGGEPPTASVNGGSDHANGADLQGTESKENSDVFEPPATVLDSPSLAVFLNGILSALNELRPCALSALSVQIADSLVQTILQAADCVSAVGGPGGAFLKQSDQPHFGSMLSSLRDLCVPHVARCLDQCLDQRGLLDVQRVQASLALVFGKEVPQLSKARAASRLSPPTPSADPATDVPDADLGSAMPAAAVDPRLPGAAADPQVLATYSVSDVPEAIANAQVQSASPVREVHVTPSAQEAPVTAPAQEAPVTAPAQEAPVTAPAQEVAVTAPAQEAPVTAPAQETPVTATVQEAPVTVVIQEAPVNAPKQEASDIAPEQKTSANVPDQEAPVSVPQQEAHVSTSEHGAPVPAVVPEAPAATLAPAVFPEVADPGEASTGFENESTAASARASSPSTINGDS